MIENDRVYHVFNRGTAHRLLFSDARDYAAFLRLVAHVQTRVDMRILAYCLMPNHWHLVLWPTLGAALSPFMHRLTFTHARQHNATRGLQGTGHVYQGRFKSVQVEDDRQLLTLMRYVEANPRVAGRVQRAEHWQWSSLVCTGQLTGPVLAAPPMPRPTGWLHLINTDWNREVAAAVLLPAGEPEARDSATEASRPATRATATRTTRAGRASTRIGDDAHTDGCGVGTP